MNPYFLGETHREPLPNLFLGQLASLERIGWGRLRFRFDAIPQQWVQQSFQQNGERELGPGEISDTLEKMPLFRLEFTLSPHKAGPSMNRSIESLAGALRSRGDALGSWFEIDFRSSPRGNGACYSSVADAGTQGYLFLIDPAPRDLILYLNKFTPTVTKVSPTGPELQKALGSIPTPDAMAVLDVGQGSANVMLNHKGRPLLYFDAGRVIRSTVATPPPGFGFCICSQDDNPVPVLLSHWHEDHFNGTESDPDLLKCTWITPTAVTIAQKAFQNGVLFEKSKVLELPRAAFTFDFGANKNYTLTKSDRNVNSPNQSGHVLMVERSDRRWLLPADASYKDVVPARGLEFAAVVASHHGGKFYGKKVPNRASDYARLVYSFGPLNSYDHPTAASVALHETAWDHGSWKGATPPGGTAPGDDCHVRATAVHGKDATPTTPAVATAHAGSVAIGWNGPPDVSPGSVLADPCPTCTKSFHIRQS